MSQSICNAIYKNRPHLSDNSIKTYGSILKSLYKNMFNIESDDDDLVIDLTKFNDAKKVLAYLKTMDVNKRKTLLSALYVLTENKAYRKQMVNDIDKYNKNMDKHEKTEEQKESWLDTHEIKELIEGMEKRVKTLYKKDVLTMEDLQEIQSYVLLCVLGGIYIPPRRSMDYCDFKIKNIDTEKDNYMLKNVLIFNSYKTSKTYGQQRVIVPRKLSMILKKWISRNPTDYLFFDKNSNPLTNVKLNQRLNKLFGKKSSVNALRHTFLTDKYLEHSEKDKELKKDTSNMGTSPYQAIHTYIKE
jgi:hypothetical protein